MALPVTQFNPAKTIIARKTFITLTPTAGVKQVETATAAGTITTAGNITVTVTAAGLTGSPLALSVAALVGDTASVWAQKVRLALAANANVAALFSVSPALDSTITLTKLVAAADDTTLNIAITNGTSAGVTPAATSSDVIAGIAGGTSPVSLIGKVVNYDQSIENVTREVPDADGYLMPDRIEAKKRMQSFKFETEDVKAIAAVFTGGGINGGFEKGTALIQIVDPNDAGGKVAVQSNTFNATWQLDGGLNFEAGTVAKATLKIDALEKVTLTPDATVA